jgi:hypothetical protein
MRFPSLRSGCLSLAEAVSGIHSTISCLKKRQKLGIGLYAKKNVPLGTKKLLNCMHVTVKAN